MDPISETVQEFYFFKPPHVMVMKCPPFWASLPLQTEMMQVTNFASELWHLIRHLPLHGGLVTQKTNQAFQPGSHL